MPLILNHLSSRSFLDAALRCTGDEGEHCNLLEFGECNAMCGGGVSVAVTKWCVSNSTGTSFACDGITADCNTAPCDCKYDVIHMRLVNKRTHRAYALYGNGHDCTHLIILVANLKKSWNVL